MKEIDLFPFGSELASFRLRKTSGPSRAHCAQGAAKHSRVACHAPSNNFAAELSGYRIIEFEFMAKFCPKVTIYHVKLPG